MGEEKGEGQEGELKYEGYKYVIEDDEIEDDDAESVDSVDTLPQKKKQKNQNDRKGRHFLHSGLSQCPLAKSHEQIYLNRCHYLTTHKRHILLGFPFSRYSLRSTTPQLLPFP